MQFSRGEVIQGIRLQQVAVESQARYQGSLMELQNEMEELKRVSCSSLPERHPHPPGDLSSWVL